MPCMRVSPPSGPLELSLILGDLVLAESSLNRLPGPWLSAVPVPFPRGPRSAERRPPAPAASLPVIRCTTDRVLEGLMTTTPQRLRQTGTVRNGLRTVRARLVLVAIVAVTALVALVAVNAERDWEQQAALRADSATGELGGEASLPLFVGAQAERRLTAVYLADPTKANRAALEEQRTVTDEASRPSGTCPAPSWRPASVTSGSSSCGSTTRSNLSQRYASGPTRAPARG